jgi:hypothetical protein
MVKTNLVIDLPNHNLRAWVDGKRILVLERRMSRAEDWCMIPKKPAPHLIRDVKRFPACAKPWHTPVVWIDASAGVGRSEKIMRKQRPSAPEAA